jgi:hypothetical protein
VVRHTRSGRRLLPRCAWIAPHSYPSHSARSAGSPTATAEVVFTVQQGLGRAVASRPKTCGRGMAQGLPEDAIRILPECPSYRAGRTAADACPTIAHLVAQADPQAALRVLSDRLRQLPLQPGRPGPALPSDAGLRDDPGGSGALRAQLAGVRRGRFRAPGSPRNAGGGVGRPRTLVWSGTTGRFVMSCTDDPPRLRSW